jgi:hypothetical protein
LHTVHCRIFFPSEKTDRALMLSQDGRSRHDLGHIRSEL